MNQIRVLKFGGTSVGNPERIRAAASIVSQSAAQQRVVVVVSAMAGVTNDLLRAAERASARDPAAEVIIAKLAERHRAAAHELAGDGEAAGLVDRLDAWFADLHSLVHGISLVRDSSPRVLDAVAAYGELFCAVLFAAALRRDGMQAAAIDARQLIQTDDSFGQAAVDRDTSYGRIRESLGTTDNEIVPVVTGFIAATEDGTTTTLGRGGSDFTATLLGAALSAEAVEIWTDVDGVMSADPRLVPQAFPLEHLSYTELMELSHFGAKVVYPPAVSPARESAIPLVIRNTLNPAFPGTLVVSSRAEQMDAPRRAGPVTGISSINRIALCRLQGAGMVGVPGIASRLFGALARSGISVVLISQASSEHSICFAVDPDDAVHARRRVDTEFEVERRAGAVDGLIVEEDYAVVAAVGEAMRATPGIAGRLFDILGRNGINVRAIAQGSSEYNISLVVGRGDEERALRLIHDAFFFPRIRNVQVFIAGTGRVGAALLDQMAAEADRLGWRSGLRLLISGIAHSRAACLAADGIPLNEWRAQLANADSASDRIVQAALASPNAHRVFVDCTASPRVAGTYLELLAKGVAIVSANKIAFSGLMDLYGRLRRAARLGNGIYAETTVGAGLPVLRPIADLVATGDVVMRIEGVLSGTLSFLFARLAQGDALSEAVRVAHERGFTEPDPRDDLSGRDVARKLLILAREAGFEIEPRDVMVEPVLPGTEWAELTLEQFWQALPSADAEFAARRESAAARGRVLAYLAAVDPTGARVCITEVDRTHPCATLLPGDNLIAVTSARYAERPLTIRGPGAGPDVTAAGVFADILRAAVESR
jgi:aspartokinase/homoserine dehydrogenase 1